MRGVPTKNRNHRLKQVFSLYQASAGSLCPDAGVKTIDVPSIKSTQTSAVSADFYLYKPIIFSAGSYLADCKQSIDKVDKITFEAIYYIALSQTLADVANCLSPSSLSNNCKRINYI